jgi:hypothetical protein
MTDLMPRPSGWRAALDPVLLAVCALGLVLRAVGLSHGLPQVYNPDEVSILSRALALGSGDLNPHNFLYPSLFFYVLAATTGALAGFLRITGQVSSLGAFEAQFWQDPTPVYLAARSLTAVAGVLTIVATYRLALRAGSRAVARVAALLVAVAYVPVRDAHFVKHDVPATLLILLAVLASWHVWKRGAARDYALAGAAVGVATAFHYYGVYAIVPLVVAHALRNGVAPRAWVHPRLWLGVAAVLGAFAACSPFVLLDLPTALRDIQANRAIIIDRAQRVYGPFGSAIPQAGYLLSQAALWLLAAVVGAVALARASGPTLAWAGSFPLVFLVFISNTWPFGRTANPLYPFLALFSAYGAVALAQRAGRHAAALVVVLTAALAAQPLLLSGRAVYLFQQPDTRTLAKTWILANVPDGSSAAVEPYSVQLVPTRAQLVAALARKGLRPEQAGRRSRALLARTPYPSPSYRLFYIGEGGMDEDKIYVPPAFFTGKADAAAVDRPCPEYVILKSAAPSGANPMTARVAAFGTRIHRETPFVEPGLPADGWLPDTDVTPSFGVVRPGPVIEVWRTPGLCDAAGAPR